MYYDDKYKIEIEFEIERQFLHDILTVGYEGGINYWADVERVARDTDLNVLYLQGISDCEEGGRFKRHFLDHSGILYALKGIARGNFDISEKFQAHVIKAMTVEDGICDLDVDDCDSIIQLALFDEIVYG